MFRNFSRIFKFSRPTKYAPILACSLTSIAYLLLHPQRVKLQQQKQSIQDKLPKIQSMIKDIKEKKICTSKRIRQGELFFTQVQSQGEDKKYLVAVTRIKGKLYAVSGFCTYFGPLDNPSQIDSNDFKQAMIFGNKLLCPHHGCAFSVESGNVQFGPAYNGLARFFVQEKDGQVILYHPSKIPKGVRPKTQLRDLNDQKKVLIMGNDHNATVGCIHALKQYEYGGQINVVHTDQQISLPYKKQYLHKIIPNLKSDFKDKTFSNYEIQQLLHEKVYSKLHFHDSDWYKLHGVEFHHSNQIFRLINKRFYPYLKFLDGSKIQFDGLLLATGQIPKIIGINGLTFQKKQNQVYQSEEVKLAPNVFMPFQNRKQHIRLSKFLNKYDVKNMLVVGLNQQSLQFIQALNKSFPQININVIDFEKQNKISQRYGPDISAEILKGFIQKGVNFYVKMEELPDFQNKKTIASGLSSSVLQHQIVATIDQKNILKGDGLVYFPNQYQGNTKAIRDSKYVDFDYSKKNQRVIVDPFSRTDTRRIFASGSVSSLQYFVTQDRISLNNPLVTYEQGFVAGLNMMAFNVPFHYIPVQFNSFLGKKILYAGVDKKYDTMYIMGDPKSWDFIAFYAFDNDILAVSASPSRQKQFQVLRECFRLQCMPQLKAMVQQKWTIPKLYKLIRKIDKSGCYRDQYFGIDPAKNISDVIWMERNKASFATDTKLSEDHSGIELDRRGYIRQL